MISIKYQISFNIKFTKINFYYINIIFFLQSFLSPKIHQIKPFSKSSKLNTQSNHPSSIKAQSVPRCTHATQMRVQHFYFSTARLQGNPLLWSTDQDQCWPIHGDRRSKTDPTSPGETLTLAWVQ